MLRQHTGYMMRYASTIGKDYVVPVFYLFDGCSRFYHPTFIYLSPIHFFRVLTVSVFLSLLSIY